MLTGGHAAELLETTQAQLEQLAAIGKVHAVKSASGGLWVCLDSLASTTASESGENRGRLCRLRFEGQKND
jgi:hypothetical protein